MLKEFIKEINELLEYKYKYECLLKDKQRMSDALYELYLEKYNNQSFEERKRIYINDTCKCCRYSYDCDKNIIPENVLMPSKSDSAWFPIKKSCGEFKWD